MAKILAFAGSLRDNAYSKRVLIPAVEGARAAGAEVTVIDLRDFPMPIYNWDEHDANGFDPNALRFQGLLGEHDGFLLSSPEYNGSIPGGLKNAIDWASRRSEKYEMVEVFKGKHAGIITSSPGSFGGLRCLVHLRAVLSMMGVYVHPIEIAVTFVGQKFDGESGAMTDEKTKAFLATLGEAVVREAKSKVKRADA
jgi:chromate reductase, NAD(P)H dehydrogenase (quinone)